MIARKVYLAPSVKELSEKTFWPSYIAHKMGSDGIWDTPSVAILWKIYTDLHEFATRGALLEISKF